MGENDCPMCDPSGSIAGLIGNQFCAAGSRPAPSPSNPGASNYSNPGASSSSNPGASNSSNPGASNSSNPSLNPQAREFQLTASSARDVSLPQSSEYAPGSVSDTQPPEETHASEERDASQEIQLPRKRQASEGTGCPKERQSRSPPPHKITSRGGSNSPEPAHSVRGSISSPAVAPTPDVVAHPTVDQETHSTGLDQNPPVSPKIQSEDPSHPPGQDQENKPDQKPTLLYSDVLRQNTKKQNQSSKKQDRLPADSKKPPADDWSGKWPSGADFNSSW
ncbi:hypothetical protein FPCIR_4319 [Fusarium pseudocircinatum]|uniref:Uncharacterized protein n=1 Tax=Fusarium pseudocircinatum TaxID=56676 RepID=A0A8H5PFJ3_9HYPO|nr:hypothetical protein FPCIR_4319 [Fusarium pseudocircinatum]